MKYLLVFSVFLLYACGEDEPNSSPSEWLIPVGQVFDGGPGKDGIPSVDDAQFVAPLSINYLEDDDLVIGLFHDGVAKAYPHPILDWHEIINDEIGEWKYALTYCPLTGTGTAWNRVIDGEETTFGVSGKLYNTNLIPYDRGSDSYWSQMRLDCVNGNLLGRTIETYPVVETSWKTWKQAYPNSEVQSLDTGFDRNYQAYPYGDYRTNNNNLIFPVSPSDNRLPAKERVFGVLTDLTKKVYSIESFDTPRIIIDEAEGNETLVIGSKEDNYIVVFENAGLTDVQLVAGELPVIAQDGMGNKLTLSGEIVAGPMIGTFLTPVDGFFGYFFAMAAFYPGIEIVE